MKTKPLSKKTKLTAPPTLKPGAEPTPKPSIEPQQVQTVDIADREMKLELELAFTRVQLAETTLAQARAVLDAKMQRVIGTYSEGGFTVLNLDPVMGKVQRVAGGEPAAKPAEPVKSDEPAKSVEPAKPVADPAAS
jgi:hypothetical protein